ncbi:MAG TPA: hypothetical protein VMV46_17610 [Thermoanaerobaculia bacterium]|nr:hypothetical protein [Thermoanaerobaculia bacterium]
MKWLATHKQEQNEAAVDPWTAVHLAAGLASGLVGWSFARSMALALLYEVVEQGVENTRRGREFFHSSRPESTLNAVTDLAVFAVGHRLGRAWNDTEKPQLRAVERDVRVAVAETRRAASG